MTTEAEKAVKDKLKETAQALFPFAGSVTWDADMVRKEMGDVLTIGHVMGVASRDGEVAKLEARVKELAEAQTFADEINRAIFKGVIDGKNYMTDFCKLVELVRTK